MLNQLTIRDLTALAVIAGMSSKYSHPSQFSSKDKEAIVACAYSIGDIAEAHQANFQTQNPDHFTVKDAQTMNVLLVDFLGFLFGDQGCKAGISGKEKQGANQSVSYLKRLSNQLAFSGGDADEVP